MDSEQKTDRFFAADASRPHDANRRGGWAFVASVAAHGLVLAALVLLVPAIERPHHDWVVAYLVEFDQSGGGGSEASAGDARAGSAPAATHNGTTAAMPPTSHHAHHRASHTEAPPPRAARQMAAIAASPVPGDAAIAARSERASAAASAADARSGAEVASATSGGSSGGLGGGGGSGGGNGSGSGFAHVAYGQNPGPSYPIEARRRAEQGTVLLRIEVGADGSVERVEVAQSSGFDSLDESAVETVRTRWRFVAARRDGLAVESWCMVPIRFALTEASAN